MRRWLTWWCVLLAVGCAPRWVRKDARAPVHWLEPETWDEGSDSKLSVVLVMPEGKATSSDAVSVIFNHPVRALGSAESMPPPAIHIDPAVTGTWDWDGTNAVTLVGPTALLTPATKYRVTVSGAVKDVHGHRLAMPYLYEFETERPKLEAVYGMNALTRDPSIQSHVCGGGSTEGKIGHVLVGSSPLLPNESLALRFNLAVPLEQLQKVVTLSATALNATEGETIESIPFDVKNACPAEGSVIELVPKGPLPKASRIQVTASPALRATVGDLDAGAARTVQLETYGRLTARYEFSDQPVPNCRGPIFAFSNSLRGGLDVRRMETSPGVALSLERWGTQAGRDGFCIEGDFAPHVTYRFTYRGDVTDVYGQTLSGQKTWDIEIPERNLLPLVAIGVTSGLLDRANPSIIPIRTLGSRRVEVKTVQLTPSLLMPWLQQSEEDVLLARTLASLPGEVRSYAAGGHPFATQVDLGRARTPKGGTGIRVELDQGITQAKHVLETNLALSALWSDRHTLLWATQLSDSKPIVGAKLTAWHDSEAQPLGLTGPDGVLIVEGSSEKSSEARPGFAFEKGSGKSSEVRPVFVIEKGTDWSYLAPQFVKPLPQNDDVSAALLVDRGVYRPGDAVHLKGWLHQRTDGLRKPFRNAEVELSLGSKAAPFGRQALVQTRLRTNEFGAFYVKFDVPRDAPLGEYTARAELGGRTFSTELQVLDYRPIEYHATAVAGRESAIRDDTVDFRIAGEYLFGPAVRGGHVEYRIRREPSRTQLVDGWITDAFDLASPDEVEGKGSEKDDRGFGVMGPAERDEASDVAGDQDSTLTLDDQGRVRLALKATGTESGPSRMSVTAGIKDLSEQVVKTAASVLVHPASFYVGLKSHERVVRVGGRLSVEVAAFTLEGRRIGGKRAHVRLAHEALKSDGEMSQVEIGHCDVTTSEQHSARCGLRPVQPGWYELSVSSRDDQGRSTKAGERIWVSGATYSMRQALLPEEVTVELDRPSYDPSATVHASVAVPWKGSQVLVALETDRVLWHQVLRATGHNVEVDIPLPSTMPDRALVSAVVVSGRSAPIPTSNDEYDRQQPRSARGTAPFTIDPKQHRMRLELTPFVDRTRPGSHIPVVIKALDRVGRGVRAEVTLFAADEGVLELSGYRLTDPLPQLMAGPDQRLAFFDARERLARVYQLTGHRNDFANLWSGRGVPAGALVGIGGDYDARVLSYATPYFNPHVLTREDGTATVEVPLGAAATSYRIMAVATSERGEIGTAEAAVRTELPLLLRTAVPRFLRQRDRFLARLLVMNQTNDAENVAVSIDTKGLALSGAREQHVRVEPHSTTPVIFSLRAATIGMAALRFDARSKSYRDAVALSLPVFLPSVAQSVTSYGHTASEAREQLGDLSQMDRERSRIEVQVSSSPFVGLDRSLEQISSFDPPLAEAVASRLLVDLLLEGFRKTYGLSAPPAGSIAHAIESLLAYQQPDGCFALWPGSQRTDYWMSAYALLALEQAKKLGRTIPSEALDQARRCVEPLLKIPDARRMEEAEGLPRSPRRGLLNLEVLDAVGPFAALALAVNGHVALDRLLAFAERLDSLPFHARAQLLEALATVPRSTLAEDESPRATLMQKLEQSLLTHVHFDGPKVSLDGDVHPEYFGSKGRNVASLLSALMSTNAHHPLAERLVQALLGTRQGGLWTSTEEASFALLALDRYRRDRDAPTQKSTMRIWFEDRLIESKALKGADPRPHRFSWTLDEFDPKGGALRFEVEGEATLHYEARVSYVPQAIPRESLDRGFFVTHTLHRVVSAGGPTALRDGRLPNASEFALGDLVLGEVTVATPTARDFVAIEAPLPAGFEALNENLVTTYGLDRALGALREFAPGGEKRESGVSKESKAEQRETLARRRRLRQRPLDGAFHVDHRELRDDRVVLYVNHLPRGAYRYHYAARATTAGRFVTPPTLVRELYASEVFGRTGAVDVTVK